MNCDFRPVTTAELMGMTGWELRRVARGLGAHLKVEGSRAKLTATINALAANRYQEDVRALVDEAHQEYVMRNSRGAAANATWNSYSGKADSDATGPLHSG